MICIRALALCLIGLAAVSQLGPGAVAARQVVPGESCQSAPLPKWKKPEQWVWERVCEGKTADFNERYGYLDPKNRKGWDQNRKLSPAFLETILFHEPFRGALTRKGVRIIGAWFEEPIDLTNGNLSHQLLLDKSRFESNVALRRLKSSERISLSGSKFTGKLKMNALQVGGSLLMSKAEFAEVVLRSAKIGGRLHMTGSKFTGKLNMDKLQVDSSLFMRRDAEFADVVLRSAKIGGQLSMIGSKFTGTLDIDMLQVAGHLLMREAEFGDVDLRSAEIGGQLEMTGSKFTGTLDMDFIDVGESLLLRGGEFAKLVSPIFAKIGSNLDISGAKLVSLDLTGTRIDGELSLGSEEYGDPKWNDGSQLTLRNTVVGAWQDLDREESWPKKLELAGFTYNRLGGFGAGATEIAKRDTEWFTAWLEKDESFPTQPYEQLASVLRKAGQNDTADDVLYAGRERERGNARGFKWWGLTLLDYSMGYGFGLRYFRALFWVVAFVGLGVGVLRLTGEHKNHKIPLGIAYSLDMLLPIIRLRESHYEVDLAAPARHYFYFHVLIGYVLASFLISGLSGLTK